MFAAIVKLILFISRESFNFHRRRSSLLRAGSLHDNAKVVRIDIIVYYFELVLNVIVSIDFV